MSTEYRGMRFCKECDNMLYPFEVKLQGSDEGSGQLSFRCKICGYVETIEDQSEELNCVYKSDLTRNQQKVTYFEDCAKDPTLSRSIKVNCSRCANQEAVTFCNPTKDRMTLFYVCLNCKHCWVKEKPDADEEDLKEDSD